MAVDPMDLIETGDEEPEDQAGQSGSPGEQRKSQLNNVVAITVALLATFMGICSVKAGNIAQEMQQAQADKIDYWAWYQARNIRLQIGQATLDQLKLAAITQPPALRPAYQKQILAYQEFVKSQAEKMSSLQTKAEGFQTAYAALNDHDDQFDLSEAALTLAIALLALTSLSQKRWLYGLAMFPTAIGILMGLAGLCGWQLHPGSVSQLLSQQPVVQPVAMKLAYDPGN
ncbi:DUF4337 domain-containing protein [Neosynechococcus sphagnicola]|uniref:DUF4337 domain-containing protein n=1 Tax=Neosynechococcus sphagnicola TaxID=1501145 RepID=UPI0006895C23|nr:DUF4337 domain-containing protein [Neosynechococcus sphagnicola]